jgi:hypothetical protein
MRIANSIYKTFSNNFKYIKYIYLMVLLVVVMVSYENLLEDREYIERCKTPRSAPRRGRLEELLIESSQAAQEI